MSKIRGTQDGTDDDLEGVMRETPRGRNEDVNGTLKEVIYVRDDDHEGAIGGAQEEKKDALGKAVPGTAGSTSDVRKRGEGRYRNQQDSKLRKLNSM